MAAKMLCAYYDQSCDSRSLFADLEIASDPSFEKHLNKYPVIFLDLTNFTTRFKDVSITQIKRRQYPAKVAQYADDLLLVGITYERDTKLHRCCIEKAVAVKA